MHFGAIFPDGVSQYLKVYITSGEDMVVGYIGDGAGAEISSTWTSPFENDSLGSVAGVETVSNIAQSATNMTSISRFNSLLVWQGATPPTFNLPIYFMATQNAEIEVNGAIMTLLAMVSPELDDFTPGGRRPQALVLDIGRRHKITDVVIQNVSYETDAPRTSNGMYTHNNVTLQVSGMAVQNRSEIPTLFS